MSAETLSRVEHLEQEISRLARAYYSTDDEQERKQIAQKYNQVYNGLVIRGWDGSIDVSAELLDEDMPQHYMEKVRQAQLHAILFFLNDGELF